MYLNMKGAIITESPSLSCLVCTKGIVADQGASYVSSQSLNSQKPTGDASSFIKATVPDFVKEKHK